MSYDQLRRETNIDPELIDEIEKCLPWTIFRELLKYSPELRSWIEAHCNLNEVPSKYHDTKNRLIGATETHNVNGYFRCPRCKGEFSHWAIEVKMKECIPHCPHCDLECGTYDGWKDE